MFETVARITVRWFLLTFLVERTDGAVVFTLAVHELLDRLVPMITQFQTTNHHQVEDVFGLFLTVSGRVEEVNERRSFGKFRMLVLLVQTRFHHQRYNTGREVVASITAQ